jgi:3-oxoacyl-[acyl-carrier protein] reductase
MDLQLRGARVLVTAASQGLGAAAVRHFSQEGAIVVINSRTLADAQATAADINSSTGNAVFTLPADVSDPSAGDRLVRNAADIMGGIDILVLNAGGPPAGTFEDLAPEAWQPAVDLTLMSAVTLSRAALPWLKKSRRAAILAIVSIAAGQPVENLTLSNVLRPAVVGLTKTLSLEFAPYGIRVNSLLPGMHETARINKLLRARAQKSGRTPDEERAAMTADIPLGKLGSPDQFGAAAVFLCSPMAGFITGVALAVDGGATRTIF